MITGKGSWAIAPVAALAFAVVFVVSWAVLPPESAIRLYDQGGFSPVEIATLPLFALIIPLVWLCCPFEGSRRRRIVLQLCVTALALFALAKETDFHIAIMRYFYPDTVNFKGTPFKMKFLTKSAFPFGAKAIVLVYFGTLFGIAAFAIARYFKPLLRGFFKLHPVCWSVAFMGGSGVLVQICDRLPAMIRKAQLLDPALMDKQTGSVAALLKIFEEGTEAALASFALLAILQAYLVYNTPSPKEELRI
ncbi:MAG: hypothetical protein IJ802_03545 [Kiritimatiellae bacterium]|nr:hypothetical protein [Kiritimatiellia bacterium]